MQGPRVGPPGDLLEDVEAEDLPGLAVGDDLEGATADLAVGRETLGGQAGIDHQFEGLTAERTLHRLGDFHGCEGGTAGTAGQGRSRTFHPTGRLPMLCGWNGVATSPSPIQSLPQGDEDIATRALGA